MGFFSDINLVLRYARIKFKKGKDYCTLFFENINDADISGCCKVHDEDYENQDCTRLESDEWIRVCVNNTSKTTVGDVMFKYIRRYGGFFWKWHQIKARFRRHK